MSVQFVLDAAGKQTAVLVPIREWERIQKNLQKPAAAKKAVASGQADKERFKEEFREAVREMQLVKAGKQQGRPVEELLAELRELPNQDA
ncbi:hypothetical protein [Hymenobacter coccineus]|uniref:Uncharacterized protein n=1 Tax=Hymenobacter coccineus TaxID=1908235 RepID=A0A1G1TMT5_9BACT|nr:hypothetical protein [Hymenobacter coccineus]OGX92187.1 hypothetical protein BEN49_16925 [Hymenobacter coccineus]